MLSSKDLNVDDVSKFLLQGLKYGDIGNIYNCNSGTVWFFCKKHNLCDRQRKPRTHMVDKLAEVKKLAESGLLVTDIAKKIKTSRSAVKRLLDENNIGYNKKEILLIEPHMEEMIELFNNGMSLNKIGKKFGFNGASLLPHFRDRDIDTSKHFRDYDVDVTFFDKIDTEEKAYVFGWFMSDGNIAKKGHMRIQIHHQDREILEKIKIAMKYTGPLLECPARNTSAPQVCLSICRKELGDKLIELGCPPNKSLILEFPTCIPDELLHHFIRGYFDGDGSFSSNKSSQYAGITSNDIFIKALQSKFKEILGIDSKYYYRRKGKSTCSLFIGRRDDLILFVNWLYKDATIWLERKRAKVAFIEKTCEAGV
jgi:hypothetical protein